MRGGTVGDRVVRELRRRLDLSLTADMLWIKRLQLSLDLENSHQKVNPHKRVNNMVDIQGQTIRRYFDAEVEAICRQPC